MAVRKGYYAALATTPVMDCIAVLVAQPDQYAVAVIVYH